MTIKRHVTCYSRMGAILFYEKMISTTMPIIIIVPSLDLKQRFISTISTHRIVRYQWDCISIYQGYISLLIFVQASSSSPPPFHVPNSLKSMSFLWTTVSALLCFELVILLALCAPLPWGVRKNISRWIFRVRAQDRLNASMKYVLFGLFLALTEALNSLRNVHRREQADLKHAAESPIDQALHITSAHDHRWKRAKAERNLYLAAFSITAWIAIARLIRLAAIEVQLRNKIKEHNGNQPMTEYGETIKPNSKLD